MKKIIIPLIILLLTSSSFSYSIEEKINLIFDKKERKIENKVTDKVKQCNQKKEFYKNLATKIFKLKKQTKYKKYEKILNKILNITIKRYKKYKVCKIKTTKQVNNKPQTIHTTNKEIKTYINNSSNPLLKNQIDINYLNYLIKNDNGVKFKEINKEQNLKLNKVNKVEKIKNKFFFKVNGKWIAINGYSYFEDKIENFNFDIEYIKKNKPGKIIFYLTEGENNKFFLADKQNITLLEPFDLEKSLSENLKNYPYFKDFLYTKKEKNTIVSAIAKKGNNLFFIVLGKEGRFYKLNKDNIYLQLKNTNTPIIIDNGNQLHLWISGMKYYYLGKYDLYKNINFESLGKILQPSFIRIAKYNKNYSVQDMYQLVKFFTNWNNKKLKDYYKWITKNIKYNKEVNDILNAPGTTPENLDKKIKANPKLMKNWIIFDSFKNKEGVCQTISDLLSLGALFNGQKADIVLGYIKSRGYGHQVSKINNFYYDPTYDLYNYQNKFFGMTKQELEKYFKITEN